MPSLTPADRRALLGPIARACHTCGAEVVRHYCRSCDEFYTTCGCDDGAEHRAHRRYVWRPDRIVAIPDFDL